ncbi:uncharacterized protein JCM6883_007212 [Sporobolomyces salmoneus]|uniref:uncharacterized protein n=1 Tax=Sporobolomyces salmoneus TaxID=183962 RepID=UPI00317D06D1
MSGCESDNFLSTGALIGLAIAGVFLFEGLVGALVWLFIVIRRGRHARKSKSNRSRGGRELLAEEGETTAYTHRSSFVEKWLGKEAVTTYTPVEIEEFHQPYSSYQSRQGVATGQGLDRTSSHRLAPQSSLQGRVSHDQPGGDVSFYSTAVAASLVVPSQIPYDPPLSAPLPRQRPELPKLDIPAPPSFPLTRQNHAQPSVTSQTSYLRRLSRSLLASFSPAAPPPPVLPVKPNPPTPPPFMKNLQSPIVPASRLERAKSVVSIREE